MVDDRQFVISESMYQANGFKQIKLSTGFVLSYQQKIKIVHNKDCSVVLLGEAWQVQKNKISPDSFVAKYPSGQNADEIEKDFMREEENWCGRYVLILHSKIFLDACGLLGVFYSKKAVSSSFPILCRFTGKELIVPQIIHGFGLDFVPGPLTTVKGIRRLLPSQIYDFCTGKIYNRKLFISHMELACLEDKERVRQFIELFHSSLINLRKTMGEERKWYLALTGGHDSRTLMALLEESGIDYACCTLEHDDISLDDIEIPKELADRVSRKHVYIPREEKKYSEQRRQEYLKHTGGMSQSQDLMFYAYGQYQKNSDKILLLRSSIWECTVEYYKKYIFDKINMELFEGMYDGLKYEKISKQSLLEYERWIFNNPQRDINVRNRYFWEQREGAWLSSIEQSFDMMENIITLQPCNSRILLSYLLSFDVKNRETKEHEEWITQKACPELSEIRYANDAIKANGRRFNLKASARKFAAVKKKYGVFKTGNIYKKKIFDKIADSKEIMIYGKQS